MMTMRMRRLDQLFFILFLRPGFGMDHFRAYDELTSTRAGGHQGRPGPGRPGLCVGRACTNTSEPRLSLSTCSSLSSPGLFYSTLQY
jgi:hypothetical protein